MIMLPAASPLQDHGLEVFLCTVHHILTCLIHLHIDGISPTPPTVILVTVATGVFGYSAVKLGIGGGISDF